MIGLILLMMLILLLIILIWRALAFKPINTDDHPSTTLAIDEDTAAVHLAQLVQKRTVWNRNEEEIDTGEFAAFIDMLERLYPKIHQVLKKEIVNGYALLYHWEGRDNNNPLVLMSHYDVVPASNEGWKHPPFDGVIKDGVVWGRGTLDTKCTLVCIMEAVENLLHQGFIPERDIYLSFSNNEETMGNSTPAIVALFKMRDIKPGLVIDEGGAVVDKIFPAVTKPAALIGVAEKGVVDLEILVKSAGGHASTPPKNGAPASIAQAMMRIEKKPFKAFFPQPTREMLRALGRYTPLGYRIVFANLWLFEPLFLRLFTGLSPETNAMCRTTVAVTMLEGSPSANVLAARARMVTNIRIAVGQGVDATIAHIRKAVHNERVIINPIYQCEPSPVSDMNDKPFALLCKVIHETYPRAVIAPYVMLGASDSRHYSHISPYVYRFSPFELDKTERESMHAVNEALAVEKLKKGIEFYLRLIAQAE